MHDSGSADPTIGPPREPGLETQRLQAALQTRMFGIAADPVTVGRFEIVERLGEGGMGTVYRARDPRLGRAVAVKLLKPAVALGEDLATAVTRLRAEARALARLSHPNVVTVLDVGSTGDAVFIAMELVEGGTLLHWAQQHPAGGRRQARAVVDLCLQAAAALSAAHAAGVVHRDVKPANMMLDGSGRLRLADFGLSHLDEGQPTDSEEPGHTGVTPWVTGEGELVGTPAYMAPEQFRGRTDERSDQFSLCLSFWEVAFGEHPFRDRNLHATMTRICEAPPRRPALPDAVPGWFRRVLLRGLSKNPDERFDTIDALIDAIRRGQRRYQRTLWLGSAVVLAAMGATAWGGPADTPTLCRTAPDHLAQAWDEPTRHSTREALAAVLPARGETLFSELDGRLADYAERWRDAWRDGCRATWIEQSQTERDLELRMRCLDRAAHGYVALVDVLPQSLTSRSQALSALESTDQLIDLESCANVAELDRRAPTNRDPDAQRRIAELEAELTAMDVRGALLPWNESRLAFADLLERARELDHPPLQVRVSWRLADRYYSDHDPAAIALLEDAFLTARNAGLDAMAVESAAKLVETHLELSDSVPSAQTYLRRAEALVDRIPDPVHRDEARGLVLHVRGKIAAHQGDYDQAIERYRELAELYSAMDRGSGAQAARAYQELGEAQVRAGRFEAARANLEHAGELWREVSGGFLMRHEAELASELVNLAHETSDAELAATYAPVVATYARMQFGPDHPQYGTVLTIVGVSKLMAGDKPGATDAFAQTLAIFERSLPESHPHRVTARINLSAMIDDPARSEELLREAHALALAHQGVDDPGYAAAASALGDFLRKQGAHDRALVLLHDALRVYENKGRPRHLVTVHSSLALLLARTGALDEAEEHAEAALRVGHEHYGDAAPELGPAHLARGIVRRARGDVASARQSLERALQLTDEAPMHSHTTETARTELATL